MYSNDASFLKTIDEERNKQYYARIIVLDKYDKPIKSESNRALLFLLMVVLVFVVPVILQFWQKKQKMI